jgi:hypothetical protein
MINSNNSDNHSTINNKTSTKLNKNQLLAAQMLAIGRSGKAVAKELGIAAETVSRWRQEPLFRAQLNRCLCEGQELARQRLASMITRALDAIEEAFDGRDLKSRDKFIMGFKILELCRFKEMEIKIDDQSAVMDVQKIYDELLEKNKKEY